MARIKRRKTNETRGAKPRSVSAQKELAEHPEWRTARPIPVGTKKEILSNALIRPLRPEEVEKLEQAIFDKRHRGEKVDLELVQQVWDTAISSDNKVKYRNIYDKDGNLVDKEPIVDYRRKQQNHILKVIQIAPPILSDRVSLVSAIQQYLAICLEDGVAYSVNGLALALGTSRETLKKWVNGETRVDNREIIAQAYQMVSLQTEMDIREGKGNPVGQIFLGKNDSGYVEEIKHTIKGDVLDDISDDEIKAKYAGVIDLTEDNKKSDQ